MTQYRVYLSAEEDLAISKAVKRLNQRPQDILRNLVTQMSREEKIAAIEQRLAHLESQNEAVLSLLEVIAGEVGFTSGAARFSTKTNEALARLATHQETAMKLAAEALRKSSKAPSS